MDAKATTPGDAQRGAPSVRLGKLTDELTGINNRRGFFARAQELFDWVSEHNGDCTAVVIDLDRLGYVNDAFGHHAGSELIRETAAALVSLSTEGDIVGRIGGDELALLRPSAGTPAATLQGEVSEVVARASRSDRPFGLAISVGVAVARAQEVETLDGLLSRADHSMYEHKQAGGGRPGAPHVRRARRG
jgi:diguanylate cyclase (GGDEF)-like protein